MTLPQGKSWTAIALVSVLADVVFLAIAIPSYLSSQRATATLQATIEIQQKVLAQAKIDADRAQQEAAQAKQEREVARQAEENRKSDLAIALSALNAQKQQPVSPDQLAQMIMARIPQLQIAAKDLPDAPSAQKGIQDYLINCDAAQLELGSCKKGLENKDAEIVARQKEFDAKQKDLNAQVTANEALRSEFEAAKKAAKGGGFWKQLKRSAKMVACASGGGALGSVKGAQGAAIGAASGALICSMF